MLPEQRGDWISGELERDRAIRIYRQRLKKKADTAMKEKQLSKKTHVKHAKKQQCGTKQLDSRVVSALVEMDKRIGRERMLDRMSEIHKQRGETPTSYHDTKQLNSAIGSPGTRFTDAWTVRLELLAGLSGDVEYQAPPTVEAPEVIPAKETGIVVCEGDWRFRIESKTAQAAKEAVVSLTDLAERLGYSDKSKLKALANDPLHRENLNKSGQVRVTRVWVTGGVAPRQVDEPLYNKRQAMYLIAKSGTTIANDLTVEFIEALESLRERFEHSMIAAHPVDSTSAMFAFLREQAEANERANERRDRVLLEGLRGIIAGSQDVSRFAEPLRIRPARQSSYERLESSGQKRIKYGVNRRTELTNLVRSSVPRCSSGTEHGIAFRDAWMSLYDQMESVGVNVKAGRASHRLKTGEDIEFLDWIEQNGHMGVAVEQALELFAK